jgi:hypothetical protein
MPDFSSALFPCRAGETSKRTHTSQILNFLTVKLFLEFLMATEAKK